MSSHISRRHFIKTSSLGVATFGAGLWTSCNQSAIKPNILLLFSDQQHWQAMGSVNSFFDTPNLDELARSSVVFKHGFCTTPQCSPSRSSIFTGKYPHKTGVMGNIGAAGGEDLHEPTFAKQLSKAGYNTAYVGKWHLGDDPVAQEGWQHFLKKDKAVGKRSDPLTTKDGLSLLRNTEFTSTPFFLALSYIDPHDIYGYNQHTEPGENIPLPESWHKETFENKPPVQKQFMTEDQGKRIWGDPKREWERYRDWYRIRVKKYDDHVGKIINELKAQGQWENTIIITVSDHGDMDTHNHLIFKGPFMYEHMVRVPFMIRVPEKCGGQTGQIDDFDAVNVDIMPTVFDFCGLDKPNRDGVSLKPLITGRGVRPVRDFVISEYYSKQKWVNPIRMLRTHDFKYTRYVRHGEELYDLKNDPHELENLADHPEFQNVKSGYANKLDQWMAGNNDPFATQKPTDRSGSVLS